MSRPHDQEPADQDNLPRAGNPNLDPEPSQDADLEPGGGVVPGSTPPESNSATASPPSDADRPRPPASAVIIGVVALIILIGMVFVAYGVGLFV